ncbi:MAG TPA: ABC transporter permease [Bacillota bacterium]|mgnify:FL=1|nr:ABC transporter permease [Bacillota bacterium]HOH10761.1 ABC transporter permease [Bacillota bacterium]HOY89596.1 ABC transporter permease [Bacillota bacterium]HPI01341.1 ABC transporter permease [Bacillota bacterium]HPM63616.1 ABC transporter permease [Bacillota bacterium]
MERKKDNSAIKELIVPVTAVFIGLVLGGILMTLTGVNAIEGYKALIMGCFGRLEYVSETIVYTTPLIFTGLAIALGFRCGLFNIGCEGQYIVGLIGAAVVGAMDLGLPTFIHLPLTMLSGMACGAIWASVPGLLKAKFGIHEVVNSIMMNYIALYLSHYLVNGPIKDPGITSPYSREILDTAKLWRFFGQNSPIRVNSGIIIAIAAALFVYYLLFKTTIGYQIRAVGFNPEAARYGGISVPTNIVAAMFISGALAGLAGAVQIMGIQFKFLDIFAFQGYGLDGIAVALVGKSHPLGVLPSALLFGILQRGSQTMQMLAGVPKETIGIMQGVIIIIVAAEGIIKGWLPIRKILGTDKKAAGKEVGRA